MWDVTYSVYFPMWSQYLNFLFSLYSYVYWPETRRVFEKFWNKMQESNLIGLLQTKVCVGVCRNLSVKHEIIVTSAQGPLNDRITGSTKIPLLKQHKAKQDINWKKYLKTEK